MSYKNEIETIEHEIKELSEILYKALVPLDEPYPIFFTSLNTSFACNDYPEAIASLEWAIEDDKVNLPDTAKPIWANIKIKAVRALGLYKLERQSDEGFKDPINHMNVLAAAGEDVPNNFAKRYGLHAGDQKCLSMISLGNEERFIRQRIADAAARGAAHYGQCRYVKRRYDLTKEQAECLVNDMWENPSIPSKLFHELIDQEKLLGCLLSKEGQERILQIRADYSIQS